MQTSLDVRVSILMSIFIPAIKPFHTALVRVRSATEHRQGRFRIQTVCFWDCRAVALPARWEKLTGLSGTAISKDSQVYRDVVVILKNWGLREFLQAAVQASCTG